MAGTLHERLARLENWAESHSKHNEQNTGALMTALGLSEAHLLILQRTVLELRRQADPNFSFDAAYADFHRLRGDEMALRAWMQLHSADEALAMSAEAQKLATETQEEAPRVRAVGDGVDSVRVFGGNYVKNQNDEVPASG